MSERTGAVVMSSRPSASHRNERSRRKSHAAIDRGRRISLDGGNVGRSSTAHDAACARSRPTERRRTVHHDRTPRPNLAHALDRLDDDVVAELTPRVRSSSPTEKEAA
jgi:hypothetical protein